MKTGQKGIDLIKSFEGFRAEAYLCPANVWTIGYGHTKYAKKGMLISEEQATVFLQDDLKNAENTVNAHNLSLNQNQFDALVSFVFNCGSGNFLKSTLLKMLRVNVNSANISVELLKWNKGGGRVLNGLTRRRKAESILYFT